MTNNAEKIIDLLKQKPLLRAVQVADLLDMDVDVAENTLAVLTKDGTLSAQQITAPNKLVTTAYKVSVSALNWVAPKAAVAQPITTVAPVEPELSRVQRGLAYLKANGRVFAKELCEAMGIEYPKYSPTQYLGNQIRQGEVIKDGKWYVLGLPAITGVAPLKSKLAITEKPTEKAQAEVAAAVHEKAALDISDRPACVTPGIAAEKTDAKIEVISILRSSLSPEEFRGYLKGSVIGLTLSGENFHQCHQYAGMLAEFHI